MDSNSSRPVPPANSGSLLLDWVADGRLAPPVGRVFGFDQYREALAFALSGEGIGKTIFDVAES